MPNYKKEFVSGGSVILIWRITMTNRIVLIATILLTICPASVAAQRIKRDDTKVPQVSLAYHTYLDNLCGKLKDSQPIDTAAAEELRNRLEEFRTLWDKQGVPLMQETVRIIKQPFRFRETIVALHVCPALANTSLPLLVDMRRYLRAAPKGEHADWLERFPLIVWHEILHRYVVDLIGSTPSTPLWKKYEAEPDRVRWHLHLMAIEVAVLRQMRKERELTKVHADYAKWTSYKRALEIVEREGAEAFLAELRKSGVAAIRQTR